MFRRLVAQIMFGREFRHRTFAGGIDYLAEILAANITCGKDSGNTGDHLGIGDDEAGFISVQMLKGKNVIVWHDADENKDAGNLKC